MSTKPNPDLYGGNALISGVIYLDGIAIFTNAGVPTDGTSGTGAGWAGIGSTCVDKTNGKHYTNTGTKASPTWTVTGTQS